MPLNAKVLIYNSLILSHLNFCILAWGYQCDCIVKLQKKIVRIISLSKYNAHTEPIFKILKLLKVYDILKLQELKFYYKYKNNKLPYYLQNLPFKVNTSTHIHATRIQYSIHQYKPNHVYAKRCIRYDLHRVVRDTSVEIIDKVNTHSLHGFSGYIKFKFLQSYQQSSTTINCYICSRN